MLHTVTAHFVMRRVIGCCRLNRRKPPHLPLLLRKCKLSTEDITYAAGQSLRVIVKPKDTEWTSFYSSLCAQQSEAFHLVDLGQLLQSHRLWKENLPHIRPYYAVKANGHPAIIKVLASLGCGFDCASRGEVKTVLSLSVNPASIVYANTHKQPDYIQFAASQSVHWYTFDSEYEIQKMAKFDPSAKLLVRLKVDNPQSLVFQPHHKFGVSVVEACSLVKMAKDQGLTVNGISFHIGDCVNPSVYAAGLELGCKVFDYARDELDVALSVMDIGGGFPVGDNKESVAAFKQAASVINESAEKVFASYPGVRLIAEPGRFFAQRTTCSFAQVIGKRKIAVKDGQDFYYYLNDGVYSSYLQFCTFFGFDISQLSLLKEDCGTHYRSQLHGPTCCPYDTMFKSIILPELSIGDWLYFKEMGAYSAASTTTFNGFPQPQSFFIVAEDMLNELVVNLTGSTF